MSARRARESLAAALLADGPASDPPESLETFGRFVGEWDVEVTYHLPDGTSEMRPGEWTWAWILDGRAIQDVWRVPPRAGGGEAYGFGTTIRLYDPTLGAWHVTWFGATSRSAISFRARPIGDEIVMERDGDDGERTRWIFSDISADRFRWRAESSTSDGDRSEVHQVMVARRRTGLVT